MDMRQKRLGTQLIRHWLLLLGLLVTVATPLALLFHCVPTFRDWVNAITAGCVVAMVILVCVGVVR